MISPPAFHSKTALYEIIFVIDRSGSMSGKSISKARDTLQVFLRSLPLDCEFNIAGFGSQFEMWSKVPVPYNKANLDSASRYITFFLNI